VLHGVKLLDRILNLVLDIGEPILDPDMEASEGSYFAPTTMIGWRATRVTLLRLLDDRTPSTVRSLSLVLTRNSSQPPVFPPLSKDIPEPWQRVGPL
jgi:hypothetical protein